MDKDHIKTSPFLDDLLHRSAVAIAAVTAIFILLMVGKSFTAQQNSTAAIATWCKRTPGCVLRAEANTKAVVVRPANETQAGEVVRAGFVPSASSLFDIEPFVVEVAQPAVKQRPENSKPSSKTKIKE